MSKTTTGIDEQRERLEAVDQAHVLAFCDELEGAALDAFASQLASLEIENIPAWVEKYITSDAPTHDGESDAIEPAPFFRRDGDWDKQRMRDAGETLIRDGKLAAFTVAGGQGTRLGFDGPKGMYPATPIRKLPLFGCLAEWIIAAKKRFGVDVPWYIMTSPINHEATVSFFEAQDYFGIDRGGVRFFSQGVLPSLDRQTGKMLLAGKGAIATNPDGHGGSLKALSTSGAIGEMRDRGIEHISYVQIDNPLARMIDPVFLGLHASSDQSSCEMSTKIVTKNDPGEKVGVLGVRNGKLTVAEYSDLSEEMANRRDEHGRLSFCAGNVAIHAIGVDFVERLNSGGDFGLPLHRAIKKVPFIDLETGELVKPEEPNAVKLESFVFDALPMCARSLVYEADRVDEFAPIKNAEGSDSPATSRAIQVERAARWLETRGVNISRDASGEVEASIEVSPIVAMEAADLAGQSLPGSLSEGDELKLY